MTNNLTESGIGDIMWAFELSGISPARLAKLAKDIPGAFNLGRGIQGWRFRKDEFMRWLDVRIKSGPII